MVVFLGFLLIASITGLGFLGYHAFQLHTRVILLNADLSAHRSRYDQETKKWNEYSASVKNQYQILFNKYKEDAKRWNESYSALGHTLGFRRLHDWYRLTYEDLASHHGGTLGNCYWRSSPFRAVKECFPDYDWHEWLFIQVPRTFWRIPNNRRRYMAWLGKQIGVRRWEDWYRATTKDFQDHRGAVLLMEHRSSVAATVMACYPERDWKVWRFAKTPMNLWNDREICRQYLEWLGEQLGYTCLDDWYRVKLSDFMNNDGQMLVRNYHGSPSSVVIDLIPRKEWCEWMFDRVPPKFWNLLENRRRYVRWLLNRLGLRRQEDWNRIRRRDFINNYGGSLLGMYQSYWDLLEECFPQLDWTCLRGHRGPYPRAVHDVFDLRR